LHKNLKSRDILFVAFSAKETSVAKKPFMSRVGDVGEGSDGD
jgi:hypothetical protein